VRLDHSHDVWVGAVPSVIVVRVIVDFLAVLAGDLGGWLNVADFRFESKIWKA